MFLDAACSSSGFAINSAYSAIRGGECDAALICGSQLILSPQSTKVLQNTGVLSEHGYCRPFDQDANGFIRGEAVVAVYLQKLKDAKRVYATLVHCKTNCDGYKEEGIFYPSSRSQTELKVKFYKELNMNPNVVNYVEAHCTGMPNCFSEVCCIKIYISNKTFNNS
jgi:fatty acid synthase